MLLNFYKCVYMYAHYTWISLNTVIFIHVFVFSSISILLIFFFPCVLIILLIFVSGCWAALNGLFFFFQLIRFKSVFWDILHVNSSPAVKSEVAVPAEVPEWHPSPLSSLGSLSLKVREHSIFPFSSFRKMQYTFLLVREVYVVHFPPSQRRVCSTLPS